MRTLYAQILSVIEIFVYCLLTLYLSHCVLALHPHSLLISNCLLLWLSCFVCQLPHFTLTWYQSVRVTKIVYNPPTIPTQTKLSTFGQKKDKTIDKGMGNSLWKLMNRQSVGYLEIEQNNLLTQNSSLTQNTEYKDRD